MTLYPAFRCTLTVRIFLAMYSVSYTHLMEFKSLRNIESSFRQIRLFGIVFLSLCAVVTVWKMCIRDRFECFQWINHFPVAQKRINNQCIHREDGRAENALALFREVAPELLAVGQAGGQHRQPQMCIRDSSIPLSRRTARGRRYRTGVSAWTMIRCFWVT